MATGAAIATAASSVYSARKNAKTANSIGGMIVPKVVNTGRSTYNTKTGETFIDPTIRAGMDAFEENISGLRGDVNSAYGDFSSGISGLRGDLGELKGFYEGNESAFKEAALNPLRESIASREGALDKELGRTGVRGSFADGARNNLAIDSGRALSDKTAEIENNRINKLGDFLGMDADLLKAGLASEEGRIGMLSQLESSLAGISMDKFNQEMQLLGIPSQFIPGTTAQAGIAANAAGIEAQATSKLLGTVVGAFDTESNTNDGATSNYDQDSLFWE